MVRTRRLLLTVAALAGTLLAPKAPAQIPVPAIDLLPGLPHPPEEPRSLYQAVPPVPLYACPPTPRYFERDPLLDPPDWPQPGWFAGVDLQVLSPHVFNVLANGVLIPGATAPDTVVLPVVGLNWTAAPRVEAGYRLASGFGEFALSYRTFASEGVTILQAVDSGAFVKSRLNVNIGDFDYRSREYSLWPNWEMRWHFGLRLLSVYYDTRADEPFDAAAAGSGVFEQGASDAFMGGGPHFGVALARNLGVPGLSFVGRTDLATILGHIRQRFTEVSTTGDPVTGAPLVGETAISSDQDVAMANVLLGLSWQPPAWHNAHFFLGYQYEYWWNVGRLSLTTFSRGDLAAQGFTFTLHYDF